MPDKLKLGLIVTLREDLDETFGKVAALGLPTCQLDSWRPELFTASMAEKVKAASARYEVEVSSVWAGHSGLPVWNFEQGPLTIGLVPPATRDQRLAELKLGADFAAMIGAPSITTHVGFIPEDLTHPEYPPVVAALRSLAEHCGRRGVEFWFETGQETPVVLLRTIEDIAAGNLGVNLDPANLILYGKGNPVDALDVIGRHVKGLHAKDGLYPTTGRHLGRETPLGQGKVDFPTLIARLRALGFSGAVTIEREISGPRQLDDIHHAIKVLTPLLA